MKRQEPRANMHQIISEYLTGNESYGSLSEKYEVNARTIQSWVRSYRKKQPLTPTASEVEQQSDVKALKKQLKQAELKNELLTEMLRLSEEQTGIDLRKKFGSGQ